MTTVIFSHGQESGPWGTKIRAMAELVRGMGCEADSIDYQGIADPTERVEKCVRECADIEAPLILVGSSMGGHVATAAAERLGAAGLFVLAPAYYMEGYEDLTPPPPSDIVMKPEGGMSSPAVSSPPMVSPPMVPPGLSVSLAIFLFVSAMAFACGWVLNQVLLTTGWLL